jgi:hypothetical protein
MVFLCQAQSEIGPLPPGNLSTKEKIMMTNVAAKWQMRPFLWRDMPQTLSQT